jgi:YVTN family beta-propeller protein
MANTTKIVAGVLSGALACLYAHTGQAKDEAAAPGYHQTKKVALPGAGTYFDYLFLDEDARRLYVSHGDAVDVLDADAVSVVGRLPGFKKVHGIAVAKPAGRVFVTDGETDQVRAFELPAGKLAGEITAGKDPDAIIYDPGSRQIIAMNNHGGSVSMIDPKTLKVTATLELGGAPEFGRADGKGTVWINLEDKSEIVRIDTRKKTVTAHWALAPCQEPTGLAFDAKHRRLFAGCGNKLMAVVDADKGKVVTTVPIGPGVDATDFDPKTGNVFNSCGGGDGQLVVVHQDGPDKYTVAETIPTQKRAKTLALDKKNHRVFLSAASFTPAPAATPENPKPRGAMVPGSFSLLVYEK